MNQRERAAFNRGLEMAARCAELYADENRRMAEDTLLADPILMGTTTRATFRDDARKSENLILDGHKHCSAALAAEKALEDNDPAQSGIDDADLGAVDG